MKPKTIDRQLLYVYNETQNYWSPAFICI